MTQTYRMLRVARSDEGVLSVVIDAPPLNLIGPEMVRDLVALCSDLEADADIRVVVLESADPEYFVAQVDLTKVAELSDGRGGQGRRAGGRVVGHVVAQAQRTTGGDDRQAPRPGPRGRQRTGPGL